MRHGIAGIHGPWHCGSVTYGLDQLARRGFGFWKPFSGEVQQIGWLIDPPDGANQSFELEIDRVMLTR